MQYNYNNLPPFKWFVLENFPFIEADFDALTNWQLMCKLGKELSKVVTSVNGIGTQVENLTEAFTSLEDYVANYFDNLDVQEEINNKLDDMAEHGELADIIAQYLSLQGIFAYNTVADMVAANNLSNGSFAKTYGKLTYNDGMGAFYKIRTIENTDVIDGENIIALTNSETLIAEKMRDKAIEDLQEAVENPEQYMYTNLSLEHKYSEAAHTNYHVLTIPHLDSSNHVIVPKLGTAQDNVTTYGVLERPLDFASRKKAELVINAGVYSAQNIPEGFLIQDGDIIKDTGTSRDDVEYLTIDNVGRLGAAAPNSNPETLINAGTQIAVLGWYAIVKEGAYVSHDSSVVGGDSKAPRQVIAQDANLNTYIFTCEGRTKNDYGMTIEQVATILINDYNCTFAYNLDGGGSTSTVLYNNKINYDVDNHITDRSVPTFLYWQMTVNDTPLKNNMFAQNIYNGEIADFYRDIMLPLVINTGNYKYSLTRLTNLNEANLKNGLYYCQTTDTNAPGDDTYLIFNYTWQSEIENDINIRQIAIPMSEGKTPLVRYKFATAGGNWGSWRTVYGAMQRKGTTAQRPATFNTAQPGAQYYDTTLHKLLIWDGTQWRDTMGNIV